MDSTTRAAWSGRRQAGHLRLRHCRNSLKRESDSAAVPPRCRGRASRRRSCRRRTIAGRALVAVVAIMTFLSCLTFGARLVVSARHGEWRATDRARGDHPGEACRRPRHGGGTRQRGAHRVRLSRGQGGPHRRQGSDRRLLEPWLGSGLDIDELPVPRLVVITIDKDSPPDFAQLRRVLRPSTRCRPRRPSQLDGPYGHDGGKCGWGEHRNSGPDVHRHDIVRRLRDPRRNGDQPVRDRGAAFHRCRERIYSRHFQKHFWCSACKGG